MAVTPSKIEEKGMHQHQFAFYSKCRDRNLFFLVFDDSTNHAWSYFLKKSQKKRMWWWHLQKI